MNNLHNLHLQAHELLSKVKTLQVLMNPPTYSGLPCDKYSTVEMVADYYEVTVEAIQRTYQRNKKRFEELGVLIIDGNKLEITKYSNYSDIYSHTARLKLFPSLCVLEFALLLKLSDIAIKVRDLIIETDNPVLLKSLLKMNSILLKQINLNQALEATFDDLTILVEAWLDEHCRVDFLINNKIVIECDEYGHGNRSRIKEIEREQKIRQKGFHVIRYNPDSNNQFELCRFIRKLTELLEH